jgi:hypothetical protein
VLVAARRPFRDHGAVDTGLPEPYRMVRVDFAMFRLLGIYTPNLLAKIPYWDALIAALSSPSAKRALAIGDFNTCRAYLDEAGAIDATAHYTDAIESPGYLITATDAAGGITNPPAQQGSYREFQADPPRPPPHRTVSSGPLQG